MLSSKTSSYTPSQTSASSSATLTAIQAAKKTAPSASTYVKNRSTSADIVFPNRHTESKEEERKSSSESPTFKFNPSEYIKQYKEKEEDYEEDPTYDEDEPDDEPKSSRYKISNLIALFAKHGITLNTIFTYKKRVMIVQITQEGFTYFVYIPSKYEMYIDRSLGIATYEMADDDEDESKDEQDTLFYSKLPIFNLRRAKKSKQKGLTRFLPLVSDSPIKIIYITQYFLCYISRHNEVDSMIMLSPCNQSGYFYLTDLEFFFKTITKMPEELTKFEQAFNEAVYNRLTVEIDHARVMLSRATKVVNQINPKSTKHAFSKVINKLEKYANNEKHRNKAFKMMVDARNKNLNSMFQIENVTYVMKEFK